MTTVTNQVSQSLLDSVNGTRNTTTNTVDAAQDRFMTLLVTQMKNQDPLNPMDNAQVTSQMAQLSTVTGVNKLNDTMQNMISSVQVAQSYQAANMIGHSVLVNGSTITQDSSGSYFGADLASGADSLKVEIKNASGVTVRTLEFGKQDVGSNALNWDGYTDKGVAAPAGTYTLSMTAKLADQTVTAVPLNLAKVNSISNQNGTVKLNLSNNTAVSTADVKEIY